MRKILCRIFVMLMVFGIFMVPVTVNASEQTTIHEIVIEDDADLLTESEEAELRTIMEQVAAYGNVAFKTIDNNSYSTSSYIRSYYRQIFGISSGTVFLIDMDNRNIWIFSDGSVYNVITDSYADVITDNIYTYASAGNYFRCAYSAFEQELALLKGQRIAQPMKYISNALLAVITALLINYFIVKFVSSTKKPSRKELMENIITHYRFENPHAKFSHQTRRYDPPSSSSSGGGGGGGGRSSGGGGGHSF